MSSPDSDDEKPGRTVMGVAGRDKVAFAREQRRTPTPVEKRLAVEVDGGVHEDQADYDEWRDAQLAAHDVRTLRLTDAEVLDDFARAVEKIKSALREGG